MGEGSKCIPLKIFNNYFMKLRVTGVQLNYYIFEIYDNNVHGTESMIISLPRNQVHALIYLAEPKVHSLSVSKFAIFR